MGERENAAVHQTPHGAAEKTTTVVLVTEIIAKRLEPRVLLLATASIFQMVRTGGVALAAMGREIGAVVRITFAVTEWMGTTALGSCEYT